MNLKLSRRFLALGLSSALVVSTLTLLGATTNPVAAASVSKGEITSVSTLGISSSGWHRIPITIDGFGKVTRWSIFVNGDRSADSGQVWADGQDLASITSGMKNQDGFTCETIDAVRVCSGSYDYFDDDIGERVSGLEAHALYKNGYTVVSSSTSYARAPAPANETTLAKLKVAARNGAVNASTWYKAPVPKPKPRVTLTVKTPKAKATKVTGKATAKAKVTVTIGKKKYSATTNTKGTWSRKVPRLKKKQQVSVKATKTGYTPVTKSVRVK